MMFLIVRSFWKTFWPGQFPVHATMQFLRRIDVKLQSVPARSQIIEHVVCSFELAVIVSQAFIIILLMKQFHIIYIYNYCEMQTLLKLCSDSFCFSVRYTRMVFV